LRHGHFAENSMKIRSGEFKTSLTTQAHRRIERISIDRKSGGKSGGNGDPAAVAPASSLREADLGSGHSPAKGEETMLGKVGLAAIAVLTMTGAAWADPIEGTWKRQNGGLITYAGSGTKFCGTVMTGKYKGQSIGCMNGSNGTYKGEVNKLDEGKTYTGKASVSGNSLSLSGCVLGGLICKSETLSRQ
jgi:uncharacterized protein (DUF2147 family)